MSDDNELVTAVNEVHDAIVELETMLVDARTRQGEILTELYNTHGKGPYRFSHGTFIIMQRGGATFLRVASQ